MNLNNFVVDRILRAVGKSKDGEILFAMNQVTNASLNVTSETAEAVDALGTPIAIFDRAKSCEFSAENAIFDLGLMAAQAGSNKMHGKQTVPCFEEFEITGEVTTAKLTHTIAEDTELVVYTLNDDGSFGEKVNVTADGGQDGDGSINPTTGEISALKKGKYVAVYQYDVDDASYVINSATEFPSACELILEVLGCNVCDQEKLMYAYLIFPKFKISSDFDWSIATDGTHPFSGRAMQDYCDSKKELYRLVIVE